MSLEVIDLDQKKREEASSRKGGSDSSSGRYILVKVVDRDIAVTKYDTFDEAKGDMLSEFSKMVDLSEGDSNKLGKMYAFIVNGFNHSDYDWAIFEL